MQAISGCGNGLTRDAPVASKADDGLGAGGPKGQQAAPGGATGPVRITGRVHDGQPAYLERLFNKNLKTHASFEQQHPPPNIARKLRQNPRGKMSAARVTLTFGGLTKQVLCYPGMPVEELKVRLINIPVPRSRY